MYSCLDRFVFWMETFFSSVPTLMLLSQGMYDLLIHKLQCCFFVAADPSHDLEIIPFDKEQNKGMAVILQHSHHHHPSAAEQATT